MAMAVVVMVVVEVLNSTSPRKCIVGSPVDAFVVLVVVVFVVLVLVLVVVGSGVVVVVAAAAAAVVDADVNVVSVVIVRCSVCIKPSVLLFLYLLVGAGSPPANTIRVMWVDRLHPSPTPTDLRCRWLGCHRNSHSIDILDTCTFQCFLTISQKQRCSLGLLDLHYMTRFVESFEFIMNSRIFIF